MTRDLGGRVDHRVPTWWRLLGLPFAALGVLAAIEPGSTGAIPAAIAFGVMGATLALGIGTGACSSDERGIEAGTVSMAWSDLRSVDLDASGLVVIPGEHARLHVYPVLVSIRSLVRRAMRAATPNAEAATSLECRRPLGLIIALGALSLATLAAALAVVATDGDDAAACSLALFGGSPVAMAAGVVAVAPRRVQLDHEGLTLERPFGRTVRRLWAGSTIAIGRMPGTLQLELVEPSGRSSVLPRATVPTSVVLAALLAASGRTLDDVSF